MSKRGLVSGLLSVLMLFGIALFSLPRVNAQDSGRLNLTTSPLPINLTMTPGQTVTTDLRVKNSGTTPERLKASLMKFSAYGEEGKPRLSDREAGDDYFDWVSFSETEFTADPNVWKTIKMTIALPDTAAFGYYYAVVFSRANPTAADSEQTGVEGGTAVLVLVDAAVAGAVKQAEVVEFNTTRWIYEFLPASFAVKIKNTGNIHLAPIGTIFITRNGKAVEEIPFNTAGGSVLPQTNRIYTLGWDNGFPRYEEKLVDDKAVSDGKGGTAKQLVWDTDSPLSRLRFGKYQATLVAVYDDGQKDVPIEATVTFWVIPWRIIGGVLLLLAALVFLIVRYVQMRRKLRRLSAQAKAKGP